MVVLEKILESPLDGMEIKSVNPKGNQPWIFTGNVRGVCNFLSSVSSQQKFEAADQHYSPRTDQCYSGQMDELCVTTQLYLENKGEYILEAWGHADPKDVKRRERPPALWLLFYLFFLLRLGLPFVNWASQECCLFCLRSSLPSSDLPLFYFHGLLPSLSFSHCPSELPFPILTT